MAKMKAKLGPDKKATESVWNTFTGLEADDGWTITYSKGSNRGSLKRNGEFLVSDVSLAALKRVAELRYEIKPDSWKKME